MTSVDPAFDPESAPAFDERSGGADRESPGAHHRLVRSLVERGLTIATGESLTAGSLAGRLAEVPGASAALRGGVVAYCNEVKEMLLDVDSELLRRVGAVDPAVAIAMARGAAGRTGASIGVATTGVAGPEPHQGKPVGLVYIGVAVRGSALDTLPPGTRAGAVARLTADAGERWYAHAIELHEHGDREHIRAQAVRAAVLCVQELIS